MILLVILAMILSILFINTTQAIIITAGSAGQLDVQSAVSGAGDGDTVIIPIGDLAWENSLIIRKSIRLIGAGTDKTILRNNIPSSRNGDYLIQYLPSNPETDGFFEVRDITFDAGNSGGCIIVVSRHKDYEIRNFRIHHNVFLHSNENYSGEKQGAIYTKGNTFGLIDQNIFRDNYNAIVILGNDDNSWIRFPGGSGSENFLYIENNTVSNTSNWVVGETGEGARWVFRYNAIVGEFKSDAHGDTRNRGVVAHEIYENIVINDFDPETGGGFFHDYRGGSGVIFNNTAQIGTNGKRGWIRVREEFATCTNDKGCEGGYNDRDQINNGYIWNNINSRNNMIMILEVVDPGILISEDEDWWDDAKLSYEGNSSHGKEEPSNFNYGTAANRPQEPTNDDCYWETDTKKLYRSIGDNWQHVYSPYIYPHPLSETDAAPQTPTGLKLLKTE